MRFPTQALIAGVLTALPGALAWGSLGHITVGYLAQRFVEPETEAYLKSLLRNDSDSYLAGVATWADNVRHTKWFGFTGVFHFIDAKDDPPHSCNVDMDRDCKTQGCVVTALRNYTDRMMDMGLQAWERAQAAKFVIHFVGDMHQPLHDEDVAKGGNGIKVLWEKKSFNLHHVWDTSIPEKVVGGLGHHESPYDVARRWAGALETDVRTGRFSTDSQGWLAGVNVDDPIATGLAWARQGNAYVCSHVLPKGPRNIVGQELGGEYYKKAAPVVEIQVARAGFRLAKWLDLIVAKIEKSEMRDL